MAAVLLADDPAAGKSPRRPAGTTTRNAPTNPDVKSKYLTLRVLDPVAGRAAMLADQVADQGVVLRLDRRTHSDRFGLEVRSLVRKW